MKVCVLGAGSWGTALAKLLADKQYATTIWTHRKEQADAINAERVNKRYLPMADLPSCLRATADLGAALHGAELIVEVVPSHALRSMLHEVRGMIPDNALLCGASKGIENDS